MLTPASHWSLLECSSDALFSLISSDQGAISPQLAVIDCLKETSLGDSTRSSLLQITPLTPRFCSSAEEPSGVRGYLSVSGH